MFSQELASQASNNQLGIILGLSGSVIIIIAASIGVWATLRQLRKQFEHKIIYEGWNDLQSKIFTFSSTLINFSSLVMDLPYSIRNQNNELINKGSSETFRFELWQKVTNSHLELQRAYVDFLQAFESHEVIFLELRKMKTVFNQEVNNALQANYLNFSEVVFPEMHGLQNKQPLDANEETIDKYWKELVGISAYLIDYRVELQNSTIGKLLNKHIPRRRVESGYSILTPEGLIKS